MGNIFSFLKKTKNTKDQLEDIQNEIDKIEEYKITTFIKEKNYYALFIFLSLIIYIFGSVYLYVTYDRKNPFWYTIAFVFWFMFPILAYYTRKLIGIYFKWIRESNNVQMLSLTKLKKKLISKVQETATFNEAKEILTKYDPNALRSLGFSLSGQPLSRQSTPKLFNSNNTPTTQSGTNTSRLTKFSAPTPLALMPPPGSNVPTPQQKTIKPILPQHRSVVEKVVDYVFNDGPSNRYALICNQCYSHNGMALPDEFEYITFICAYCNAFNPARKIKPPPPTVQSPPMKAISCPIVELPEKDDQSKYDGVKITELTLDTTDIPLIDLDEAEMNESKISSTTPEPKKINLTFEQLPTKTTDDGVSSSQDTTTTTTTTNTTATAITSATNDDVD